MTTDLLASKVQELRDTLPLLLTTAEAAEVSPLSKSTIRRAVKAGALPYNQPTGVGGDVRIPTDAFLDWAFSLKIETRAKPKSNNPTPSGPKGRRTASNDDDKWRKRRTPLRVVPRGTQAWSEEEMLNFASAFTG